LIVPLLIEKNLPIYDSGASEFFSAQQEDLNKMILPVRESISAKYNNYSDHINKMVKAKDFDLLILTN